MTLRHRFLLLFFFPLTTSVLAQAVDLQEPGTRKQLLVDNLVISDLDNVQRVLGTVTRLNQGKPIFTDGKFYGTVVHDQGRFKMWWRKPEQQGFGYAESQDGIHFTRLADLSGINFAGDYTLSVTIDGHETDPVHRYKAAYDAPGMAAGIAHSADGIRWTPTTTASRSHIGPPIPTTRSPGTRELKPTDSLPAPILARLVVPLRCGECAA
jgi:hypothetical protein